ncbi:MAG: hypothetical protein BGO93_26450 [Mesorhizobium sp. 65-26]|nr:MAG: hypothetical protein BGO93_26450 [Mesorhizobium sp. 65-26]
MVSTEIFQGFGESGETPDECARRELKEECGISVPKMQHLFVIGNAFPVHIFTAKVSEDQMKSLSLEKGKEEIEEIVPLAISRITTNSLKEKGIFDPVSISAIGMFKLGYNLSIE